MHAWPQAGQAAHAWPQAWDMVATATHAWLRAEEIEPVMRQPGSFCVRLPMPMPRRTCDLRC
eukprot:107814-Chlamydomonas_euryale.AAC.2